MESTALLEPGDKIWTRGRLARHYGIFVGRCGVHSDAVIHNVKGRCVSVTSFSEFAPSGVAYLEQRANPGTGSFVVAKALQHLGRNYDLFKFNCEHFVNGVHDGQARSPQLSNAVGLGVLGTVLWAASRNRADYDPYVDRYRDRRGRFVSR